MFCLSEAVFFHWTLSMVLILVEYYFPEAGSASIFRERKARNAVDALERAILSHWAPQSS
jgi:hypothetical protein